MKKPAVFYSAVSLIIGIGTFFSIYPAFPASAQQPSGRPLVKTSGSTTSKNSTGGRSERFRRAAAENSRLRTSLPWEFGGRSQSGWEIYVPLISRTIGTDHAPDSLEFAFALSNWQRRSGVADTGILDRASLDALIKYWQSKRIYGRGQASEDLLVSAPMEDFYDPTREPELRRLERETYGAYKRMLRAASKDLASNINFTKTGDLAPGEKFLSIVSAFRSPEYQESLRKKEPNAGRAALAKSSVHSTGRAIDLFVGGEPVTTKDANRMLQIRTAAYRWLVENADKFGFVPYFYEPWHWEYVGPAAR